MKGSARAQAAIAIDRIMRTGAYSNVVTAATVVSPPTDHGFYQRLVYTTLRHLPAIDAALTRVSNRPLDDLDPMVIAVLRTATAELVFLGTQAHAAVHEAVETIRTLGRSRASGFVNAVMRAIADHPPDVDGSMREAYPEDVLVAVEAALGTEEGEAFLRSSNQPAPMAFRQRAQDPLVSTYVDEDRAVPHVSAGSVDVIDPASVAVAAALDPQPNERILDMAAAPGGKTRAIADAMGHGMVVAMDRHRRRLVDAARRSETDRMIRWLVGDGSAPPLRPASFDRVVVDAPCSGLGTLRRRPEIRYRFRLDQLAGYRRLQRAMLEAALALVRPGGVVVYSACTVTREETVEVVSGLGFEPPAGIDGERHGDGLLLAPHVGGTDGMFIARHDAPSTSTSR